MHRRLWSRMDKTLGIRRTYQGFNYVEDGDGNFAFISDSRQVNPGKCDLATVGNLGKLLNKTINHCYLVKLNLRALTLKRCENP